MKSSKKSGQKATDEQVATSAEQGESNVPIAPEVELGKIPRKASQEIAKTTRITCQKQKALVGTDAPLASQETNEGIILDMDDKSTLFQRTLITVAKYIKDKYKSFVPYKKMVEYLFLINKSYDHMKDDPQVLLSSVDVAPPFHLLALFYFKKTIYSSILQGLCD